MDTHVTADKLVGLPGMPISKTEDFESKVRAVAKKLMQLKIPYITDSSNGGRPPKAYETARLPAATYQYLVSQAEKISQLPATMPASTTLPAVVGSIPAETPEQLAEWRRTIMYARLALIRFIETETLATTATKAIEQLVNRSLNGTLPPEIQAAVDQANARAGESRALSITGVTTWWRTYLAAQCNPLALAPKAIKERSTPPWAAAFLICWRRPGAKVPLTDTLEDLKSRLPAGVPMPSYDQARGYLNTLGTVEKNRGRMTGNELNNIKPHRRRTTSHMLPGDAYTADGHTHDCEWAHPFHGRPFRPEITPVIDVFSRKIVGWSIDLAESGLAVLDALRMACEVFGPPAIFYTDNGSGYKNQMMTAEGTGLLHWLGIDPQYSRPRNPKAHGISERAHQTVLIRAAKELCTYIGADMDQDIKKLVYKKTRKEVALKESGELAPGTPRILIEFDDGVAHIAAAMARYNSTPHKGLPATRDPQTRKRTNLTPNQAWDMGIEQMKRERPEKHWLAPANELPDLYHPKIIRTVQRGEIQMGTKRNGYVKRYYSADLKEYNRVKVFVAFSPSDPSQVWVRSMDDQRLLAVAKLDGNASEYFAQSFIEEKLEQRGVAAIKRHELKIEEIELEMHGPEVTLVARESYDLPTETIEKVARVIELSREKDQYRQEERHLRENQHEIYGEIRERERQGHATAYEVIWANHYDLTDKGKRYGHYKDDPYCQCDPERQKRANGEG